MSSCQKYLDIQRSNLESPIKTASDIQLLLDNTTLNNGYPSDMELSSDDFYVNDDGYNSTSVSSEDRDFYIWSSGAIRSSPVSQWQQTYKIIYYANLVLEYAEKFTKDGTGDPAVLAKERGAGLFFRAYSHWWIAQLYAKPYSAATAGQDAGIPLRLKSDINEKSVRGTLEETYNSILQDLQEAATLLPNTVTISSRPSKAAAYAMLARVYLSMEKYPEALSNATSSLQINNTLIDFNSISTTADQPFIQYNKEVIFNAVTTGGALMEPGSSIPIAIVDPKIISSYDKNDLRGTLFVKSNPEPYSSTYHFSGNYAGTLSSALFNGLAVDEVYLTRAEAYARTGDMTSAMADLNILLKNRWLSGTYVDIVATNADDALSKILIERRKELLFRGLRWTDLRRLNKDIRFSQTLTRTVQGISYTILPNDLRYTLLIPTSVIQYTGIGQNPR